MKVEKLRVGQLQSNCYLVWDPQTKEGIIIDPADDADFILRRIKDLEIKPLLILATHGHFDHVMAAGELKLDLQIPFLISEKDIFLIKRTVPTASFFTGERGVLTPKIDRFLKEDEEIVFGGEKQLKVIFTPGHSPGGVAFFGGGVLFSGDTLFAQSIGRTDLSYSSHQDLLDSIKNKLFKLPDETIVYSGHGEETTIAEEKENFNSAEII
jgi:glyoxylase-like metal-dependent hydrolase (beta-lactamase superfamily II)